MRCGTTALSNILCSRPEISGYGEAHIRYRSTNDLGRLVVNQTIRKAWKPKAGFLFDKLLHNRHDDDVPPDFIKARALFMCRRPEETIPSIRRLFKRLGRDEYTTDHQAAEYYAARIERLSELWALFATENRIGLDYDTLMNDTDRCLEGMTGFIGLAPPLENRYRSHSASIRGGGGDPLVSSKLKMIEPRKSEGVLLENLDIDPQLRDRVRDGYQRFLGLISEQSSDLGRAMSLE